MEQTINIDEVIARHETYIKNYKPLRIENACAKKTYEEAKAIVMWLKEYKKLKGLEEEQK